MKNKPLELDNELNKTNEESEEKISVSGNCSIYGGMHGVFESSLSSDTDGNGVEGYSGKARAR